MLTPISSLQMPALVNPQTMPEARRGRRERPGFTVPRELRPSPERYLPSPTTHSSHRDLSSRRSSRLSPPLIDSEGVLSTAFEEWTSHCSREDDAAPFDTQPIPPFSYDTPKASATRTTTRLILGKRLRRESTSPPHKLSISLQPTASVAAGPSIPHTNHDPTPSLIKRHNVIGSASSTRDRSWLQRRAFEHPISRLPLDVCERIIGLVAEDHSDHRSCHLLACALTCRAWLVRSQHHLAAQFEASSSVEGGASSSVEAQACWHCNSVSLLGPIISKRLLTGSFVSALS